MTIEHNGMTIKMLDNGGIELSGTGGIVLKGNVTIGDDNGNGDLNLSGDLTVGLHLILGGLPVTAVHNAGEDPELHIEVGNDIYAVALVKKG